MKWLYVKKFQQAIQDNLNWNVNIKYTNTMYYVVTKVRNPAWCFPWMVIVSRMEIMYFCIMSLQFIAGWLSLQSKRILIHGMADWTGVSVMGCPLDRMGSIKWQYCSWYYDIMPICNKERIIWRQWRNIMLHSTIFSSFICIENCLFDFRTESILLWSPSKT